MTDHFTPKPKVVFIAGAFDGLHIGHLNLIKRARALGDRLIIGLNADPDLAAKGPGRPIDEWRTRATKLTDTGLVYCVRWFTGSPLDLILDIQPDIIAVGSDYTLATTVGYPECLGWGGVVTILPRTPGISTTQLVRDRAVVIAGRGCGKTDTHTAFVKDIMEGEAKRAELWSKENEPS